MSKILKIGSKKAWEKTTKAVTAANSNGVGEPKKRKLRGGPNTLHSLQHSPTTKTTGYRPNHERLDFLSGYKKTTTYKIPSFFHLTKTTGYRPNHEDQITNGWIFFADFTSVCHLLMSPRVSPSTNFYLPSNRAPAVHTQQLFAG